MKAYLPRRYDGLMGNPKGTSVSTAPSVPGDNGIMAQVPGQHLAAAQLALPPAETMQNQVVTVEADGGWVGRVRITFQSTLHKFHRTQRWVWREKRVERA